MERKETDFKEQFEHLSPKERNNVFRQMWFSLPFNVYRDTTKFAEDLEDGDPLFKIATKTDFDPEKQIKQHFEDIENIVQNREKSEVRKIQFKKMQSLLEFAPVTQSFRHFILKNFNESYIYGLLYDPKKPYEETHMYSINWILESDQSDSEGIFGKEKAQELDSKGYKHKLKEHFWLEALLEMGIEKGKYTKEQYENWLKKRKETESVKKLKQWRKEHIELFNDEP